MRDLTPELLPQYEQHHLPGLDVGPGTQYPYYAGGSLVSIPSAVCRWLGAPPFGSQPMSETVLNLYPRTFDHLILLVIDGMGLNTFQSALEQGRENPDLAVWQEMTAEGALAPLTSIAPSTTAAALTTFWTGCAPAEHGVMAYDVWLKEYGLIANMILHAPTSFAGDPGSLRKAGFDPDTFLPIPTLGSHLARHGVRPYAFQYHAIARSGLSTMLLPGVEVSGYRSLSDLWVSLGALMDARAGERNYTYIYWGDLDEHSHRFGPQDQRVALELASFSRQLAAFYHERKGRRRGDTLLLITADHGHISTPKLHEYDLRNHPGLMNDLVMPPSGEARLPFVYLRPSRQEHFLRYVEETWPGQFRVLPSEQALNAGLFGLGVVYARTPDRIGDFVVVPQGNAYWWFGPRDNPLLGRHGGLSRTEMLTPLFSLMI